MWYYEIARQVNGILEIGASLGRWRRAGEHLCRRRGLVDLAKALEEEVGGLLEYLAFDLGRVLADKLEHAVAVAENGVDGVLAALVIRGGLVDVAVDPAVGIRSAQTGYNQGAFEDVTWFDSFAAAVPAIQEVFAELERRDLLGSSPHIKEAGCHE